jgi:hypothetical protein
MLLFLFPFMAAYFAIFLVVGFFFLLNLRDLLQRISPQNQAMEPNQVWLNLIPLFNLVWIFITVIRVRESLQAEFRSRGWAPQGDFGYGLGLAAAILSILNWGPLGVAAFICWIIYWVRMSELKNLLRQAPASGLAAQQWPNATSPVGPASPAAAAAATCAFCGTANVSGARFCNSCGRPVA